MFIALRRFTLLFTILLERYWLKKSHDWPTLSAMGIMIGGGWGWGRGGAKLASPGAAMCCCAWVERACCWKDGGAHGRRARSLPYLPHPAVLQAR